MIIFRGKRNAGVTDMTAGSPIRHIVLFAIPLLIGNVFQQLYNMVDSIVVGRFVGDVALAAVGTGFPIIFLMNSLFFGVGMGATVMISQFYGAKDLSRVAETVNTIYSAFIVAVVPFSLISMALSGPILRLIQVPADTFPDAHLYMLIIFAGVAGGLGFNLNSAILQGLGDSKTPLLFLSVACGVNIVLDLVFVLVFSMGVAGVALATIIAQAVSWIFGTCYINRRFDFLNIRLFQIRLDRGLLRQILRLGIPSGLQQALFSIGTLAIQSLVNTYGSSFMAGFNGANKLDTFAFMPIQSFSIAVTTYTGQNIGAGRMDRVKHGTRSALAVSMIVGVSLGLLTMLFGRPLMSLFSSSPEVIEAGLVYLYDILPFYGLFTFFFILVAVMRGAGDMVSPMLCSVCALWLARVPSAYLFAHYFGRDAIFFSYAVGWALGDVMTLFFYFKGNWRRKALT